MREPFQQPNRRAVLGMSAGALILPGAVFASGGTETIRGMAFGTTWRITGPVGAGLKSLREPVERLLDGIDRRMSPWRAESEIGRFNAAGPGRHPVSPDTEAVARAALRTAAESGGRFDPTLGPAVARWGFGPIGTGGAPGWEDLALSPGHLSKPRAGLTFDPCGIAKGWALDRLADLARENGHADLLIDLGGELAALGRHPADRPWQVAVEDPRPAQHGLFAVLAPGQGAVATSGLRAQSYRARDRTYGHIIDPATGEPVRGRLLSVSVRAAEAVTADAWATALFAAGDEAGPELARRRSLDALFLIGDGGHLRYEMTGAMAGLLL